MVAEWLPGMFCPVSELLSDVFSVGGFRTTTDTDWEVGLYPGSRPGMAEKVFCEAGGMMYGCIRVECAASG